MKCKINVCSWACNKVIFFIFRIVLFCANEKNLKETSNISRCTKCPTIYSGQSPRVLNIEVIACLHEMFRRRHSGKTAARMLTVWEAEQSITELGKLRRSGVITLIFSVSQTLEIVPFSILYVKVSKNEITERAVLLRRTIIKTG